MPADSFVNDAAALSVLRADLAAYLATTAVSPATKRAYASKWRVWQEHCQSLPTPVEPLDAPFEAYAALLVCDDLTPDRLGRLLSAIRHFHEAEGLTPAYRKPEHQQRWRTLQRGHARKHGAQNLAGARGAAKSLTREHARQLLTSEPERNPADLAYTALVLLHLDLGMGAAALSRLTATDVSVDADGVTAVSSTALQCDHEERVRGVPWDCTACAVREVLASRPSTSDDLLFSALAPSPEQIAKLFRQAIRRTAFRWYPHLLEGTGPRGSRTRFVEGASPYEMAGVRRGLILLLGVPGGPKLVRARAWAAVAWTNGMRMASDLVRVRRDAVREDPAGGGFSITIGRTKADQSGSRGTVKTVQWAGSSGAREVAEYLCCRDAMIGQQGFFLTQTAHSHCGRGGAYLHSDDPIERSTAENDFDLLVSLAGLHDEDYTPHSLRRGNATQRNLDGQAMEHIRGELGHRQDQTTSGYIDVIDADDIPARLLQGLNA